MRRISHQLALCLAVGAMSACKLPDPVVPTVTPPTAGVRFVNATPDTAGAFGLDFRFVDKVESNAQFRMTFRNAPSASAPIVSTLTEYKAAAAGTRHYVVFLDDTLQTAAQIQLAEDAAFSIAQDHNYTVILWGNARSSGAKVGTGGNGANDKLDINVIDETTKLPTVAATAVAMRAINTSSSSIDVTIYPTGGSVATPTVPTFTVAPYSVSAYYTVPPGFYQYNVKATGGANLFNDTQAIPGAAATIDIDAVPGTTVGGSAVTGWIYPRSATVPAARTPQTGAFLNPAIAYSWDKRPPRTCSPLC